MRVARKHISRYSKGQPNGAGFRQRVNRVDTIDEQLRMTHAFFDSLSATREMAA